MNTITITLKDLSKLPETDGAIYVAGWINGGSSGFKTMNDKGKFVPLGSTDTKLKFHKLSNIEAVTLSESTNGNDRLLFTATPTTPSGLSLLKNKAGVYDDVQMYTQSPYSAAPGVAPEGPYDVFEFGMNAAFDLSAVNGFALNLRFAVPENGDQPAQEFGVHGKVSRAQVGTAFTSFLTNQSGVPGADAFGDLLYDGPMSGSTYTPPMIGGQYFSIADPNDYLAAITGNYVNDTTSGLKTYWTSTLQKFFVAGNTLAISIPVSENPNNIYSGSCITYTNPTTKTDMLAYRLVNSTGDRTYYYFNPLGADPITAPNDLQGAQYVFQQAFTNTLTPGIVGVSEAQLVQDAIWEAICRGVVLDGTFVAGEISEDPQFSTTAWNNPETWYGDKKVSHLFAKFLHCSDVDGNDYRSAGTDPIMIGGAAYGFSMDEAPMGAYSGPQVPSKTTYNIGSGTVAVAIGPWS
ncbi:hypothetical protein [uncultured Tateyamaria sp.]|uniref:hypothetical protein n=1 Tax=uncultured Tateyamaria sp. TaxID=455651 RepID=UPI0026298C86|nr:hypothetical protein [uncultured Tateyamaria sp.]